MTGTGSKGAGTSGATIELIKIDPRVTLDDYAGVAHLCSAVQELRNAAETQLPQLMDRTVMMVNSTAQGGGVAEILPQMVVLMRELGLNAQWAVMNPRVPEFFRLTKKLHNLIHGQDDVSLSEEDLDCYLSVSQAVADQLRSHLTADDLLVIHDPQPLGAGALLKKDLGIRALWRCHVGGEGESPATEAAWTFLRRFTDAYDHAVFSAPQYIPEQLAGRASVIHPGIDPLSHKNRELNPHKLTGILCNAGLARDHCPVLTAPFARTALRLQRDGRFGPASEPDEIGFLYRPIVAQISRWDRLKGFLPLMQAFVQLKERLRAGGGTTPARHRRRLEILRLVLAGPEPAAIQDDPEGQEVLEELCACYRGLSAESQKDIVLLSLPMDSRKNNELMVNAIQRCASVVVQNSIQEGFGLTVTEAMWKGIPVLGTEACGLRQQIRDKVDGRLTQNPEDPDEIADLLDEMLSDDSEMGRWGRNGQKRVHTGFLIFAQLQQWLRTLAEVAARPESVPSIGVAR